MGGLPPQASCRGASFFKAAARAGLPGRGWAGRFLARCCVGGVVGGCGRPWSQGPWSPSHSTGSGWVQRGLWPVRAGAGLRPGHLRPQGSPSLGGPSCGCVSTSFHSPRASSGVHTQPRLAIILGRFTVQSPPPPPGTNRSLKRSPGCGVTVAGVGPCGCAQGRAASLGGSGWRRRGAHAAGGSLSPGWPLLAPEPAGTAPGPGGEPRTLPATGASFLLGPG